MRSLEEIVNHLNITVLEKGEEGFFGTYVDPFSRKIYSIVFSWGMDWEHLSVNPIHERKTPTWELMCRLKDIFWKEDEACVEYHPVKDDYVNNMPFCLHIWKPSKEKLPTPPAIMVGIKELGDLTNGKIHKN